MMGTAQGANDEKKKNENDVQLANPPPAKEGHRTKEEDRSLEKERTTLIQTGVTDQKPEA